MLSLDRRLTCLALIVVLTSWTHCSKEEPAPVDAPITAEKGNSEKATSGDNAAKKGAADNPGELAKSVSQKPAMMTMPESVIAILGLRSFNDGIQAAKRMMELMEPDAPQGGIVSTAKEGLKENFGWSDVSWLDMDKPVRIIMPDAKAYDGNNLVLILPTMDKDKMLAALPEGSKTKDGPHAAVYEAGLTKLFVNFVDGHVVIADDTRFFELTKPFLTKDMLYWNPEQTLTIKASTARINTLYGDDITAMKTQLLMALVAGAAGGGADLSAQVDLVFGLMTATDELDIHLWLEQDDLKIRLDAFPKKDTFLASYAELSGPKRSALAPQISPQAWFASIGNLDPVTMGQIMTFSNAMMGNQPSGLSPEDEALLKGYYEKLSASSTGDSAIAGYIDDRFPFALSLITKVTDSQKALATYESIYDVMFKNLITAVGEAMGGDSAPPQLRAITNTEQLIATINAMARPMGAKAAMFSEEREGVAIRGVRLGADWKQIGQATGADQADPELFKAVSEVIGGRIEIAMGHKDQTIAMALGPKAVDTVIGLVLGKALGGEAGVNRLAPDYNMIATIRPETMLKALAFIPPFAERSDVMAKVPMNRPFQLATSGASGWVRIDTVVPMDVLGVMQKLVD